MSKNKFKEDMEILSKDWRYTLQVFLKLTILLVFFFTIGYNVGADKMSMNSLIYCLIYISLIQFIIALFEKERELVIDEPEVPKKVKDDTWHLISEGFPKDKILLIACDTYDCGWVIDRGWYGSNWGSWMVGVVGNEESDLPYSHWRELPDFPKV